MVHDDPEGKGWIDYQKINFQKNFPINFQKLNIKTNLKAILLGN